MTPLNGKIRLLVGAAVALLLQLILAPNIHIFYAAPNFVLCFTIAVAVCNPRGRGYLMPFLLGLMYDFMNTGTVGAMAFTCVAITFISSLVIRVFDNEEKLLVLFVIIISVFLAELIYGLLMIACGTHVSFADALLHVVLPCGLYDTVLTLLIYPLVMRFVLKQKEQTEMTIIDSPLD